MQIICAECGEGIRCGTQLLEAGKVDFFTCVSICQNCIRKIPENFVVPEVLEMEIQGDRITFYKAKASCSEDGVYTLGGMILEKPLFSVPEEIVRKYLPKFANIFSWQETSNQK